MADTVTTQILENGPRWYVAKFTNFSDGTGETNVVKINATTGSIGVLIGGNTIYPQLHLKIRRVEYDIGAMAVRLQWVASLNQDIAILKNWGAWDFFKTQGWPNPGTAALSGATGSIAFTTVGAAANSSYTITLWCDKGIPQS